MEIRRFGKIREEHTIRPPANSKPLPQLAEELRSPGAREQLCCIAEQPYILIDLDDDKHRLSTESANFLKARLADIPCPLLGLRTGATTAAGEDFSSLVDVLVGSEKEARPLISNIEKHPIAAMVLVQLTRHNERASIADGLLAESLAYSTLQGGKEFQGFLSDRRQKNAQPAPAVANSEPAVLARRSGNTLHLTLNRPESRNAFSLEMRDGLVEALELLAADTTLSRASIDGAGACFCSGGYLEEFGSFPDTASAHAIRSIRNAGRLISEQAHRIEFHVHRACIGSGIELPAFADKVVAAADTLFQLPEISLGLVPGAGGTVSITRRIGRQRMNWLTLSGRRINAATALEWGLIDEIDFSPL